MPRKKSYRKKLSRKKLVGFYREEMQTAKEYRALGFARQGKQEAEHARFFKKKASEL
jgi:hypothetical protein